MKKLLETFQARVTDVAMLEAPKRLDMLDHRDAVVDRMREAGAAIEAAFIALERERDRFRADLDRGYSDVYKTQLRYREAARVETERRGFKEHELQWLWRGPDCFKRKYDIGEVVAAICDALCPEGQTAWPGDGTSCVEQMIRLQWERAERAEAEVERLKRSR